MKLDIRGWRLLGGASGDYAVHELGGVARELEKTRRFLIGAACLLFIVSACLVMFAPAGREGLSYILGAVLLTIALGVVGVSQFRLKLPGVEVEGNSSGQDSSEIHAPRNESRKE